MIIDVNEPEAAAPPEATPIEVVDFRVGLGSARAFYAVFVLTLVYCFAYVDRQIFNLLVTPIRKDFDISDLQVSYLLGPAFILSYVALGLPAGWCVDRFNRRNLILCAGVCWGLGTISGAFAHSYAGLFISRLMVGASEAIVYPAGISFIADLFDRRRLPLATSMFVLAPSLGGGLALIGGGLVLDHAQRQQAVTFPMIGTLHGWQFTLLVIGFAGMIPVLLLATVRDAARQAPKPAAVEQYSIMKGTGYMMKKGRFYIAFFLGLGCNQLVMLTISAWAPTYLERSYKMTPGEVGTYYGPLVLLFGIIGGVASPIVNAWLARWWALDSTMRTVMLAPCMLIPITITLIFVHAEGPALACLALLTLAYNFPLNMASTALQLATPARLLGVASAWYFIIGSLIGYGIGPTIVPFATQNLFHDPARIGTAMGIVAALFSTLSLILCAVALNGFQKEQRSAL